VMGPGIKRGALHAAAIAIFLVFAGAASAQSASGYPNRPIRMVVPFAPGNALDIATRIMSPKLAERLGQQVVVENKPGAGGNIGTDFVAKSAPDGYTVGISSTGPISVNVTLYSKLPYDPIKDLAPVSLVAVTSVVLVAHPGLPVTSVRELIALAKAKPGYLSYASAGTGTAAHLSAELFKMMTSTDLVHVPYKGDGAAATELVGGQIPLAFMNLPSALPHIRAGRIKPLAVTLERRSLMAPEIPTLAETGVPGYEAAGWFGAVVAGGTPPEIIARLNGAMVETLKLPEVRERMLVAGIEPSPNSPEQFGAFIKSEMSKWAKVVKVTGARVE
jgi:tripartite-type tricarboxylate transporter receptor subunit TctC